ncbi:MAG: serine hydrolase domain-containing protein [Cyclobacteriaceae bacterium]
MRRFLIIFTIAVLAIGFVFYTRPDPKPTVVKPEVVEQEIVLDPTLNKILLAYEEYIIESQKQTGTPGAAIAIVKDSSIIYLNAFGVKEKGRRGTVDVHTSFRLASVSKSVTASLVGILVEDGVFAWDDPVVKFLPDFKLKSEEQTKALTLRHLLSHTTGLPYHAYTNLIEEGDSLTTMMNLLGDVDLIGGVGSVYSYQNVAFSIIAEVVKAATGNTFEDEMKARVFGPLHMTDASIDYLSFVNGANIAQPHLMRNRKWKAIPISQHYYNTSPAGGVNASITDMGKWLVAMLGNKNEIISKTTIDTLFTPEVRATAKNRNFNKWNRIRKSYYGLGWRVINFKSDTIAYHGGYVNGFRSEVAIHPQERIAICVLANSPSRFADHAIPTFFKIYDKYNNEEVPLAVVAD